MHKKSERKKKITKWKFSTILVVIHKFFFYAFILPFLANNQHSYCELFSNFQLMLFLLITYKTKNRWICGFHVQTCFSYFHRECRQQLLFNSLIIYLHVLVISFQWSKEIVVIKLIFLLFLLKYMWSLVKHKNIVIKEREKSSFWWICQLTLCWLMSETIVVKRRSGKKGIFLQFLKGN